jgi:hypothetical protein
VFDDPELPVPQTARSTYFILGEAVCAWVRVVDIGLVFTQNKPDPQEFARIAIENYNKLTEIDHTEWVLTGKWLEETARISSIHPVIAKELLTLQRHLWCFQHFKHAALSMRHVGPMVSVLYPDYLFDLRF